MIAQSLDRKRKHKKKEKYGCGYNFLRNGYFPGLVLKKYFKHFKLLLLNNPLMSMSLKQILNVFFNFLF